jgi:hypothetical protein
MPVEELGAEKIPRDTAYSDAGQASPSSDPSWDPVWSAATRIDSLGWTAELRIPFSQLRFPHDSVQTWGMQVARYEESLSEESIWSFYGKRESGGPTTSWRG